MLQGGPDPNAVPVQIALAVIGIALVLFLLPRQLRRTRQYGGRPSALAVVAGAVVLLGISLQPSIVTPDAGLALTLIGVLIALRPEAVIQLTGGPRPEYLALESGTKLQRLVARHHDRRVAEHTEAVKEELAKLPFAEYPGTERYLELLRATLFEDPEAPGMSEQLAALAVEEAKLRKVIGPRPAFEGGLAKVEEAPLPDDAGETEPGETEAGAEAGDPAAEADEAEAGDPAAEADEAEAGDPAAESDGEDRTARR